MTVQGAQHTFPQGRAWSLCDVLGWREQDNRCTDGGARVPLRTRITPCPGLLLASYARNFLILYLRIQLVVFMLVKILSHLKVYAFSLLFYFVTFRDFLKKLKSFTHLEFILKYSERWVLFSHNLSISPVPVIWGMKSILSPLID